uniref:Serpin domain-containing protein n=1 Tax=Lepisosteus oculatus TaxID=7918 RepID=W5MH09_LEPOC
MDLHLPVLLLLCLSGQALMDDDTIPPEDGDDLKTTTVPLPPTTLPHSPAPTHDPPEYFYTPTTWQPTTTTSGPTPDYFLAMSPGAPEGSSSEEESPEQECRGGVPRREAQKALGAAVTTFGLELLQQLLSRSKEPNIVVSPLSVALALSQLALGAVNETEALLLRSLHVDKVACYHSQMKSLLQHLSQSALAVATRTYLSPGFKVNRKFIEDSWNMYGSEPAPLKDAEDINRWVEEVTKGRVKKILVQPAALCHQFSADHTLGVWRTQFDPRMTTTDLFYLDRNTAVPVDMMVGPKYPLRLHTLGELNTQVARFQFKGNMSLLTFVPLVGQLNVSAIADHFNASELYSRFSRERPMSVKLPKLNLEYSQDLREVFTAMGLGELFSGPDLSGIGPGPLLVSSVQHKSTMEVNEQGAEAAAATSVVISRSSFFFSLNRPFFFALLDDTSHTPLFLGVVTNPNPGAPLVKKDDPDKFGPRFSKQYGHPNPK